MLRILSLICLLVAGHAHAFDLVKSVKKYGLPCAASLGASVIFVEKEKAFQMAALGCTIIVVGGELVTPENSLDEKETLKRLMLYSNKQNKDSKDYMLKVFEQRFDELDRKIVQESIKNKEATRNAVVEVGIVMEDEIYKKVQQRMRELEILPELKRDMVNRIKEEVIAEYKNRKSEFVEDAVNKVIKRVTAEPIVIEGKKDK